MLPKGPFSRYFRRRSPLPAFLCGTPEMRAKKIFRPPDFGGAHPSDPRLQLKFYAYYFGDPTPEGVRLFLRRRNSGETLQQSIGELPAVISGRITGGPYGALG
jgi:hypothetical protein